MLSADPLRRSHEPVDCADNATGFRINPLSCASPLSHPRFLCSLALGEPWRLTLATLLAPEFPDDRRAAHDRERDTRHLVGKRHGDEVEGLLLHQLLRPHPRRVRVLLAVKQHGMRPDHEQFAMGAPGEILGAGVAVLHGTTLIA
jgi:hypothetical protein